MGAEQGYVWIHRELLEHPVWNSEPFSRGQAWVDLILLANYKDGIIRRRGILVKIKRGQVGMSEVRLAKRWKWSRGKVRRFLFELEHKMDGQIVQQKSNVTSIITIPNYGDWQSNGTPSGTPNGHQTDTKRYRNNKEKKEKNPSPPTETAADLMKVWNEEAANMIKARSLTPTRERHCKARLKERSLEEHREIIRRANQSNFLTGGGERGWKANIDWYIRSEDQAVKILEGNHDNKQEERHWNYG